MEKKKYNVSDLLFVLIDLAVLASPKITNDGSLLLAAGAGPEVYCLRAEEARSSWVRPTSGKVVASPVLSEIGEDEDEFAVYFMEVR